MRTLSIAAALLFTVACQRVQAETRFPSATKADFGAYWNQGKAEVTSYTLSQARYGELHEGHAVLVFVTEPFSADKQVKLDRPGPGAVPVLKLNFTRKFNTGVYPYSMMTSVFSPTSGERAIKVTSSSQEWCGHTFFQLNQRPKGYAGRLFSYFESEGDQTFEVPVDLIEDELWTRIRIAPERLPQGEVTVLPGATHLRLRHLSARPAKAIASVEDGPDGTRVFRLKYTSIDRELAITFEAAAPYQIQGWTERYVSGWGPSAETLTTTAKVKQRLMSDYWNRHGNADRGLRKQLGLPE